MDFPLETDDHVVIVTRCHQTDEACLRHVLDEDREPASVGVVASKRKARVLLAKLLQDGYARERVERVRSPIGLDIGAETPEEIAVSIVGEILALRGGRDARPLSDETVLPANVTVHRVARSSRREAAAAKTEKADAPHGADVPGGSGT
jgi:xanthine dehydrogenase accessory factor